MRKKKSHTHTHLHTYARTHARRHAPIHPPPPHTHTHARARVCADSLSPSLLPVVFRDTKVHNEMIYAAGQKVEKERGGIRRRTMTSRPDKTPTRTFISPVFRLNGNRPWEKICSRYKAQTIPRNLAVISSYITVSGSELSVAAYTDVCLLLAEGSRAGIYGPAVFIFFPLSLSIFF